MLLNKRDDRKKVKHNAAFIDSIGQGLRTFVITFDGMKHAVRIFCFDKGEVTMGEGKLLDSLIFSQSSFVLFLFFSTIPVHFNLRSFFNKIINLILVIFLIFKN